jgi:hypothetical protein
MMNDLFDPEGGKTAKRDGMELAAENRETDLDIARRVAKSLAIGHPERLCQADQVGRVLKARYGITSLGPAAGSIFKGREWEFTGQRVLSARTTNHARELKVWRYVGPEALSYD